jgi:hypothetical protein
MEEELDTCSESAGCSAMGPGEGWDCSLLEDLHLVQSGTILYSSSMRAMIRTRSRANHT